jgi:hypothetical protein
VNVPLSAGCHASFDVSQILPGLGSNYRGTIQIATPPANQQFFVALVLSGDGGVLSSYPASNLPWPTSQNERIWKIWQKVLNETLNTSWAGLTAAPTLVVDSTTAQLNSYACAWPNALCPASSDLNKGHIFMNIAELMSDSDSELAFVIAHEMGHMIQGHGTFQGPSYLYFVQSDIEWDADAGGSRFRSAPAMILTAARARWGAFTPPVGIYWLPTSTELAILTAP